VLSVKISGSSLARLIVTLGYNITLASSIASRVGIKTVRFLNSATGVVNATIIDVVDSCVVFPITTVLFYCI
jgi:hypothetical protein